MTEEQIALAKRAVACKGWRWMPGMRTTEGMRTIHDPRLWPDRPCAIREGTWVDTAVPRPLGDHLPDLTDPATLGCLLALVREAWGDPYASSRWIKPEWKVLVQRSGYVVYTVVGVGKTEEESLVAALEAAP
jgi:hypothetical protein